jgi:acetyl esterase/lipase
VFAVVHGSQPRFTIPEIVEDMRRAVRFVRANAARYKIDSDKLGITGASAGGHLSLMMGTSAQAGDPAATDPVDRVSSQVAAVGCFFPPTDFLNYGQEGESAIGEGVLSGFKPPFAFLEQDPQTKVFLPVTNTEKRRRIARDISPVYHVSKESAPTLIIHGDADKLVPIQQAETMIQALKAVRVPCELVVKSGAAHGWPGIDKDVVRIADWFDTHLK